MFRQISLSFLIFCLFSFVINAELAEKPLSGTVQVEAEYFHEVFSLRGLNHRQNSRKDQTSSLVKLNESLTHENETSAKTFTLM